MQRLLQEQRLPQTLQQEECLGLLPGERQSRGKDQAQALG